VSGDAWYRWKYSHPAEAEDPRATFWAGMRVGRRDALQGSAYVQVVPLLEQLLHELIEDRIDADVEASDQRMRLCDECGDALALGAELELHGRCAAAWAARHQPQEVSS
jgi:hypothetical protein